MPYVVMHDGASNGDLGPPNRESPVRHHLWRSQIEIAEGSEVCSFRNFPVTSVPTSFHDILFGILQRGNRVLRELSLRSYLGENQELFS